MAELLARIRTEASYRGFSTPAELGRLVRDDLAALLSERFAARSAAAATPPPPGSRRLPVGTTSLVGRERAIDEVSGLLGRLEVRLVTLTGPGGVGKTRLALAAGEVLCDRFDEVVFVPLETATRPEQVLAGIARAVGAALAGTDCACRSWSSSWATAAGCSSWTTWNRCSMSPATSGSCWPAARTWRSW